MEAALHAAAVEELIPGVEANSRCGRVGDTVVAGIAEAPAHIAGFMAEKHVCSIRGITSREIEPAERR
jgi:hypothetical protein